MPTQSTCSVLPEFPRRHNRGRIEAAMRLVSSRPVESFPRRHNRGRIEAIVGHSPVKSPRLFPRRHNRGRIEASPRYRDRAQPSGFHGVTTVAELKRHEYGPLPRVRRRFHGVTTVAELKQPSRPTPRRRMPPFPRRHNRGRIEAIRWPAATHRTLAVSTASQPWPN